MDMGKSMYNHNKAQQSKNGVHISWDILYATWRSVESYCALRTESPDFTIVVHQAIINFLDSFFHTWNLVEKSDAAIIK